MPRDGLSVSGCCCMQPTSCTKTESSRAGLWGALRPLLSDAELIELCMLVGHYEMLAMTLNSLGVEPTCCRRASRRASPARMASRSRCGARETESPMSRGERDINGRRVLITGAARGIGALLARRLHDRGARVALLGLEPDLLGAVAAQCGGAPWYECDVTPARTGGRRRGGRGRVGSAAST